MHCLYSIVIKISWLSRDQYLTSCPSYPRLANPLILTTFKRWSAACPGYWTSSKENSVWLTSQNNSWIIKHDILKSGFSVNLGYLWQLASLNTELCSKLCLLINEIHVPNTFLLWMTLKVSLALSAFMEINNLVKNLLMLLLIKLSQNTRILIFCQT